MSHALAIPDSTIRRADVAPAVFECTLRDGGLSSVWVHATGDLDIAGAPLLEQALRLAELRARLVVLDLRDLAFIDTCGVHLIVYAYLRARRVRRRLIIARGPSQVDRLFALTGASDVLEVGDLGPVEPPVRVSLKSVENPQ